MITLADDISTEPGCYVESGWGHYGSAHLIEQFCVGEYELQVADDYKRSGGDADILAVELVTDLAEAVEMTLNEILPDNRIAGWRHGEFFIMTFCGDHPDFPNNDCTDEMCGCHDW